MLLVLNSADDGRMPKSGGCQWAIRKIFHLKNPFHLFFFGKTEVHLVEIDPLETKWAVYFEGTTVVLWAYGPRGSQSYPSWLIPRRQNSLGESWGQTSLIGSCPLSSLGRIKESLNEINESQTWRGSWRTSSLFASSLAFLVWSASWAQHWMALTRWGECDCEEKWLNDWTQEMFHLKERTNQIKETLE